MPTMFIMMIGLPGSGKSTLAEKIAKDLSATIHSSDELRKELYGNVDEQSHNGELFNILHDRIKSDLLNGTSVIYDGTNISYKRRKAFVSELKNIECRKVAVMMAVPYEICLEQNTKRERKVPEEVIEKMYKNFDVPGQYEGWDDICLSYPQENYRVFYDTWQKFLFDTTGYSQDTEFHSASLGEHCRECLEYISNGKNSLDIRCFSNSLNIAGALHDCGKPFCKTFVDSKGNLSKNAHYYGHEHVGSYNSLFYDTGLTTLERHYMSLLIRWHMQMWAIEKQPELENKYKELLGTFIYRDLELLHRADKSTH